MVTREGSRYCNRQAAASYGNSASTQHFTAECDEHGKTENPGEQACLDIRWGILSSATWEKSGLEFWLGFFLETEVARTSQATKENLSSKVTSRI